MIPSGSAGIMPLYLEIIPKHLGTMLHHLGTMPHHLGNMSHHMGTTWLAEVKSLLEKNYPPSSAR